MPLTRTQSAEVTLWLHSLGAKAMWFTSVELQQIQVADRDAIKVSIQNIVVAHRDFSQRLSGKSPPNIVVLKSGKAIDLNLIHSEVYALALIKGLDALTKTKWAETIARAETTP